MMKRINILKRAVSVLLCITLVFSVVVCANAQATPVSFVLSTAEYSPSENTYLSKDTFKSDEILFVRISSTEIKNLGGLAFRLSFPSANMSFMENKSICGLNDEDISVKYFSNNDIITVILESSAHKKETSFIGVLFYLAFKVNTVAENTQASFSFAVQDFYDNSSSQKDIESNKVDSVNVAFISENISGDTLELFRKLKTIKYPDSKEDIDIALEAYKALSSEQKKLLQASFAQEYEWISSATSRYNRLAEKAGKDKLLAEVNGFKNSYSRVLALDEKKVTASDEPAISKAISAYDNLSAAAKTYLQAEGKLLHTLEDRIIEIKDINAEVEDFLSNEAYTEIWNREILNNRFDITYIDYASVIQLALLNYDLLSDEAKQMVQSEYEWLSKLNDEANKYLALDTAAAELAEKTAQFQNTYLKVFMLNQNNATKYDRSAIEMVIEAYNSLEDEELKAALKFKMDSLKSILEMLNGEEEIAPEGPADTSSSGTPEKETIYVNTPGETKTEYITNTEKVTETLGQKLIRNITQRTPVSNVLLILFVLLTVAIIVLFVSYILCERYKKKILQASEVAEL